jgi:ligand-binding sensor domain-containing protein
MPEHTVKNYLGAVGQLLIGILVIVVLVIVLQNLLGFAQVQSTPPGWQIIRPPQEVSTLIIENDTVWTGGKDGVILIDRSTGARISTPAQVPSLGYVRQIFRDSGGWIWVGHDGGLARFRNGSWVVIAPATGVPFSKVLSIAERRDGTMVVGTDLDVFSCKNTTWTSLRGPDAPAIASADVLLEDSGGDLWVGSGQPTRGGLYRLNGTSWSSYTISDGLPHLSVRGITQARDGTIWVATGFSRHGGAALFSGGTWKNLTVQDGLAGESTRSVYEDTAGRMWIGSEYDGIAVGAPGAWKILTEKDGLAGYEVKVMAQDRDGTCWLGTNSGLNRIDRAAVFRATGGPNPG